MTTHEKPSASPESLDRVLARNPFLLGRHLFVHRSENEVVVRGMVGSYFQKQMAQEILKAETGNRERIRNEILVIR